MKKKNIPHYKVSTRLGVSKIKGAGVGVIAIKDVKKGTLIFYGDEESKIVWIKEKEVQKLPPKIRKLYNDFGIFEKGKIGCPANFNQLTPSWYLNEDKKSPNVKCDKKYNFWALRDIKEGEELFVNYDRYSDPIIFK